MGCSAWRQGWLAQRPREPRELLGCQQRRYQSVHWILGFSRKFWSFSELQRRKKILTTFPHTAQGLGLVITPTKENKRKIPRVDHLQCSYSKFSLVRWVESPPLYDNNQLPGNFRVPGIITAQMLVRRMRYGRVLGGGRRVRRLGKKRKRRHNNVWT